jgi:hypothetical protein
MESIYITEQIRRAGGIMITHNDQLNLFQNIGNRLKNDVTCYAFGGTAMMFYGYKQGTKDIDLLFKKKAERDEFINAIRQFGFKETSLKKIYIPEKLRDPHRPLMFKQEDNRFDLFVDKIFHTTISAKMKEDVYAKHEYKGEHTFTVYVLRTESIVMLKAVTERDKDFEDILTIIKQDKHFNWQYLVDEVIWQYKNGDSWVLIDTIKMLHELRKYTFVEQKYLKQLTKELR